MFFFFFVFLNSFKLTYFTAISKLLHCHLTTFPFSQHHSPVTPVTTLCAEAREAAQKLLNHYVKVGFHLQHSLGSFFWLRENTVEKTLYQIFFCVDLCILLFVSAGSGSDHLPDAKEERWNTGLGQHHRATKCSCCDEESSRRHHLDWCAGNTSHNCSVVIWTVSLSTLIMFSSPRVSWFSYETCVLNHRWVFCMKKVWGKHTAVTPAKGLSLSIAAPGSKPAMLPATLRGK